MSGDHSLLVGHAVLIAVASRCRNMDSRTQAFSSCGTWAPPLQLPGSRAQAQYLWCTGLVAPRQVGSFRIRYWAHVLCFHRRILLTLSHQGSPALSFKVCILFLFRIPWDQFGHSPPSSTLAWKIPWTEEPGMLQFMGSQRVGHNLATELN